MLKVKVDHMLRHNKLRETKIGCLQKTPFFAMRNWKTVCKSVENCEKVKYPAHAMFSHILLIWKKVHVFSILPISPKKYILFRIDPETNSKKERIPGTKSGILKPFQKQFNVGLYVVKKIRTLIRAVVIIHMRT